MTEPLYKWLLADRRTPTQRVPYPEDETLWTPSTKPVLCESGWHGMLEKDVLNHLPGVGAVLYEVEARGEVVLGGGKFSAESMRFKYRIGEATERNLRLFAADCAEDVLPLFLKGRPDDNRPARAIEAARQFANGEIGAAAGDAAGDAAGAAAGDAAGAAARAAARAAAWAAAGDAAWAAAGDAARAAAGAAAGAAAWAAAGDAARAAARAAAGAAAGDAAGDAARAAARAKYSNWLVVRVESDK
jgi:hypothetical protein